MRRTCHTKGPRGKGTKYFLRLTLLLAMVGTGAAAEDTWQIPLAEATLVTDDEPAGPVERAIAAFVQRVAFLSGEAVSVKPARDVTPQDRQEKHLIVVGNPHSNSLLAEELGDSLAQDFAGEKDWVVEEGYRVEIRGNISDGEKVIVLAGSLGQRGVIYALSDLEMKLAYTDGRTVLVLGPETPGEDTPPGPPFARGGSVLDDADETFSRVGWWGLDGSSRYVEGAAYYSGEKDAGRSEMSVLFSGTWLDLVARKLDNAGIMAWSMDDEPALSEGEGKSGPGEVDLYAPAPEWQARIPIARGLKDTLHVVTFRHTGRHNPDAVPYYFINVDAILADGIRRRLEDDSGAFRYAGPWNEEAGEGWSGNHLHFTGEPGAAAEFEFWGDSAALIYAEDPAYGIAEVELDGEITGEIDMYRAGGRWARKPRVVATGLDPTRKHRLVIRCTGRKNPASSGAYVLVDAVEIRPGVERVRVEKPALRGRGVYLNFGDAPDRYILPIGWTPAEWERYVDQGVKARLNFITVYLWYPNLLSAQNVERNRVIHESIRHGLRYAHARGLKFKYLFTPTTIPENVHEKCPVEYRAVNPFYNAPLFCPSVPGAVEVMKEIYRQQIEFFREADAFQVAFFDPGGCLCDTCRRDLGKTLTEHFVTFEELIHAVNPAAQAETALWNADEFAQQGYPWADDFLRHMAQHYGERAGSISIFGRRNWAEKIKAAGFITEAFLFETNHETSYCFFTPQLPRLYQDTRDLAPWYDSAFCHRLEAGTKFPNTFLCASWFWNPGLSVRDITDRYALGFLGTGTEEALHDVIMTLDALTFESGNLHLAPKLFAQTRALEHKVKSPPVRQQMNWFFVSLYGTAKLAELAATADPEDRAQRIRAFYDLLRADPTFAPSVESWIEPMQKAEFWSSLIVTGNRHQGF